MRIFPELIGILPQILSRLRSNGIICALSYSNKDFRVGGQLFFLLNKASPPIVFGTVHWLRPPGVGALFASWHLAIPHIVPVPMILLLWDLVRTFALAKISLTVVFMEFSHSGHWSLPVISIFAVKLTLALDGPDNLVLTSIRPHQFGLGLLRVRFMIQVCQNLLVVFG